MVHSLEQSIKEKPSYRFRLMTLLALNCLLFGLLIQGYLGFRSYREDLHTAGLLWQQFTLESAEDARERRSSLQTLRADAAQTEKDRLLTLAQEKGETQRGKHLELLLLVNPWHELPEGYAPELAPVVSNWQVTSPYAVDSRCAEALRDMLNDCLMYGGVAEVCSAYRTQEYQQMLFDNKIERLIDEGTPPEEAPTLAATTVALPGTSEHQLGLAVDILDISYPYLNEYQMYTGAQRWLMEHSWEYGFILRYPEGTSEITGIIYEPWHYRYVGEEHAEEIHALGLTLEEYLELRNGR